MRGNRRILFCARSCYLDDSNGAAVASRALMQAMSGLGFSVEVLCGPMLDLGEASDAATWLARKGRTFSEGGESGWIADASGIRPDVPRHFRLNSAGVPITMHRGRDTARRAADPEERREFLRLLDDTLARFRPDIVISYGSLAKEVLARARHLGAATVFALHNLGYRVRSAFDGAEAILVPSRHAAEYYKASLELSCTVLPNLIDRERVRVEQIDPKYITIVNPSPEKGGYVFARIAHHLGAIRPDIPFLAVEGRGTEADLAGCGLDLRQHSNVRLMAHTDDPRRFWRVTRLCLVPSLVPEAQGLVAVEAMTNGIPVVASDRGALPETLGHAGLTLPLPGRLGADGRIVPTADEVSPWIDALIRLWDDDRYHEQHRMACFGEAHRWDAGVNAPRYAEFFEDLCRNPRRTRHSDR